MAAVLVVGGCASGDGDEDGKAKKDASQGQEHGPDDGHDHGHDHGAEDGHADGEGGAPKGDEAALAAFTGGWTTNPLQDDGDLVFLIVSGGKVILTADGAGCTGRLTAGDGPATLTLKCEAGGKAYSQGEVRHLTKKSMTVAWESGRTSEFTKSKPPAGLSPVPDDAKN